MARILVICRSNRHGLGKDGRLITDVLRRGGHRVTASDLVHPSLGSRVYRKVAFSLSKRPLYDMSIHVESCVPTLFRLAKRNVLIPNPEFLRPETAIHLSRFDAIFCKTDEAMVTLGELGFPVMRTGFSSPRPQAPPAPRTWPGFFHASGAHSPNLPSTKGTAAIYRVWGQHPDWPLLTISGCELGSRKNVECIPGFVPGPAFAAMQSRFGVHLCLSEMEGFGHYIVEPMSLGCVVVATDGAPMNEHVRPDRGYLVAARSSQPHLFGVRYVIDESALAATIERIIATEVKTLQAVGERARAWYEANDACFRSSFLASVHAVIESRHDA